MMRHVFLSRPITARPSGMVKPATATALIAPGGLLLIVPARRVGAVDFAITLTAVATRANENLAAASRAQEGSGNRLQQDSQEKNSRVLDTFPNEWQTFPALLQGMQRGSDIHR